MILLTSETFGYCPVSLSWDICNTTGISSHCVIYRIPSEVNGTVTWNSTAGYGCKSRRFYSNVTSQLSAKSSLSQVMTPLQLNFLWKNKKDVKIEDTKPRSPLLLLHREIQAKRLQRSHSSSHLLPPAAPRVEEGKASSSAVREEASLMSKFQFHLLPDQIKAGFEEVMPYLLYSVDVWQSKPQGSLEVVTNHRAFYLFRVGFFFNTGQHFNAGSSLSPKVSFNDSSYHLSLILKSFALVSLKLKWCPPT